VDEEVATLLLHWLPVGAGGHFVAFNGRVYETIQSRLQHRRPAPLFHAALAVHLHGDAYVIEMGPVWGNDPGDRGVVVEGPVGLRVLGRSRLFRYEVRAWRNGTIDDLAYAVGEPTIISRDPARAADVLSLVRRVPPLTWGRDELGAGEMWNSNSMVAWLLFRSGNDLRTIAPPGGGRAPGWRSGIDLATRSLEGDPDEDHDRSRRRPALPRDEDAPAR
jgi:hypothetical protein